MVHLILTFDDFFQCTFIDTAYNQTLFQIQENSSKYHNDYITRDQIQYKTLLIATD